MSDRVSGRHRSPQRASTPLTLLRNGVSQRMGEHTESLARGGAAVAITSGLVASMAALPAQAAITTPHSGELATSTDLQASTRVPMVSTLTASAKSNVVFDRGSLTATETVASRAAARIAREKAKAALAEAASNALRTRPERSGPASSTSSTTKSSSTTSSTTKSSTTKSSTTEKATSVPSGTRGSAIVSIARRYIGIAYVYGGTTPSGFDCSGFTQYVFRKAGVSLPRTAAQQAGATRSIPRSQARAGDLVFILSGGRVGHVGIVTRPGYMIDSPRTGKSISERKIYSSNAFYRRVVG